jgi:serine protease Do
MILGLSLMALIGWTSLAQAEAPAAGPDDLTLRPMSFAPLVEREKPAVVNISTTKILKNRAMEEQGGRFFGGDGERHFGGGGERQPFDFFGDDFFRHFFGGVPDMPERKQRSLGSGFIIDRDGHILTNNHVVEDADEIVVTLSNKEEYKAEVIGKDQKTDIALIKIKGSSDLPVADIGDSEAIRVGDWVVAIGNPFGLEQTVTAGIVSAKGRVIGAGPYDDFIQTDASINPGNSGGPLFNLKGEVVGINTAIIASGQGIGFAIPINMAKDFLPQLKKAGKIVRGWIGIKIQKLDKEMAKGLGLKAEKGALVAEVMPDTPAEKAGVKRGDVILGFNGKEIGDERELTRLAAATPVGKTVKILINRNGKEMELGLTLGEYPDELKEASLFSPGKKKDFLGMKVQDITPDLKKYFDIDEDRGVLVSEVKSDSPADEAGIYPGDLILEVNRQEVNSVTTFMKAMDKVGKGDTVVMLLKRKDGTRFVAIKNQDE